MPTFAAIEDKKQALRRKAQEGAVLIAPYSASPITVLTSTGSSTLLALPTGWKDAGLTSDDGLAVSRAVERAESTSWGRTQPTLSDITTDTETIAVTFQETNKVVLGLASGVDLTAVVPDSTTGEIAWEKPDVPEDRYYRLFGLGKSTTNDGDFYVGLSWPRVKVTDFGAQSLGKSDDGIVYNVTFTSFTDDVLGYSKKTFLAGPGAKAMATLMGFAAA